MRYFKIATLFIIMILLLAGCPRRQVVQPEPEEVPEEVPFEEVVLPEPEEPPKPMLILERIFFDFDKSDIRADAAETLNKNADMLKIYPDVRITIEGHCCEIGTAEYNLALGERRSKAARDYMLMLGVTPDRISTVSYGEEKPLDPGNLEMNRRCEFSVQ